jgi:hypothetical protein
MSEIITLKLTAIDQLTGKKTASAVFDEIELKRSYKQIDFNS